MQHAWVKRRQKQAAPPAASEKDTRRQLAWAAGSEYFANRDPLYHVTESFQQTFDEIGRRHAAEMAGETVGGFARTEQAAQPPGRAEAQTEEFIGEHIVPILRSEKISDKETAINV